MKIKIFSGKVLCLCVVFLFLFMTFYNFNDFNTLFLFQRIGIGIISVLFFISFFFRKASIPKYSILLLLFFLFLTSMATVSSNLEFGQPVLFGISGEYKLLGVFYFFFALTVLRYLKPTISELEQAFLILALLSLISFSYVHLFVNAEEVYNKGSNLVLKDAKGYRFKFEDIFIVVYLFYTLRKFLYNRRKFFSGLMIVIIILYLLFFQKERAEFFAIVVVLGWRILSKSPAVLKGGYILLVSIVLVWVLFQPDLYSDIVNSVDVSSLNAREHTFNVCYQYITGNFYHFLTGAGNLNSLWKDGFTRLFGNNFFLSDIGWLGVVYEFGFIGALLCVYFYFRVIKDTKKVAAIYNSYILFALVDYTIVRFILSVFSPHIPYFIGIYSTVLAINVYLLKYNTYDQQESLEIFN
jgi:hypothetical protein